MQQIDEASGGRLGSAEVLQAAGAAQYLGPLGSELGIAEPVESGLQRARHAFVGRVYELVSVEQQQVHRLVQGL